MKRIVQKIKSYSKSVELSEGDKDDLRAKIVSFMKTHPIEGTSHTISPIKSPYSIPFSLNLRNSLAITAIVALVATASITSAAENALPGDMLYPVKVHVNENVHGAFIFGKKAEAAWHTQRAERRFEEIEQLIARGELDESTLQIAQAYLDTALNEAEIISNPVRLGAVLEAHATILTKIDEEKILADSKVTSSINDTRKAVTKKRSKDAANDQGNAILAISTFETASEKKAMTKERIDKVMRALTELDLDKETNNRVNARTQQALDAYMNGSAALEDSNYNLARDKFIESMMHLQEAKLIASVPKFLGFENVANIGTSTKQSLNEGDVTDDIDKDKETLRSSRKSNDTSKSSENEDRDNRESNNDKNEDSDDNNVSNTVKEKVKDTEEKVKEVQKDIQDNVQKLIP